MGGCASNLEPRVLYCFSLWYFAWILSHRGGLVTRQHKIVRVFLVVVVNAITAEYQSATACSGATFNDLLERNIRKTHVVIHTDFQTITRTEKRVLEDPEQHHSVFYSDYIRMSEFTMEAQIIKSCPKLPDTTITVTGAAWDRFLFDVPMEAIMLLERTPQGLTLVNHMYDIGIFRIRPNRLAELSPVGSYVPAGLIWELMCDLLDDAQGYFIRETTHKWINRYMSGNSMEQRAGLLYLSIARASSAEAEKQSKRMINYLVNGTTVQAMKAMEFFHNVPEVEPSPKTIMDRLEKDWHALEHPTKYTQTLLSPLIEFKRFSQLSVDFFQRNCSPEIAARFYHLFVADSKLRWSLFPRVHGLPAFTWDVLCLLVQYPDPKQCQRVEYLLTAYEDLRDGASGRIYRYFLKNDELSGQLVMKLLEKVSGEDMQQLLHNIIAEPDKYQIYVPKKPM